MRKNIKIANSKMTGIPVNQSAYGKNGTAKIKHTFKKSNSFIFSSF